ncbi:MAG TPA: hypothetical protein VMT34_05005 [Aggregatilineales bacterium]|nr:hypothetical protein [Aggregatilineales bacterium]
MTEASSIPTRRTRWRSLRRVGCGLLLAGWFVFLLTPCLLVYLAANGEIVLTHSDVPDDQFRIWTISSTTTRGIAASNARRVDTADGLVCTLTDVSFLIWQGKGSAPQHYCACYSPHNGQYQTALTGDDACKKAGGG